VISPLGHYAQLNSAPALPSVTGILLIGGAQQARGVTPMPQEWGHLSWGGHAGQSAWGDGMAT